MTTGGLPGQDPGFDDPGLLERTELILSAVAARRGVPAAAGTEASDPAAWLLAALAADVDQGCPGLRHPRVPERRTDPRIAVPIAMMTRGSML